MKEKHIILSCQAAEKREAEHQSLSSSGKMMQGGGMNRGGTEEGVVERGGA